MIQIDSIEDLQQLKSDFGDPEVVQVVELIQQHIDEVRKLLEDKNPSSSRPTEGMCLFISRFFNDILKKSGFRSMVLQGEIEVAENSWLEHHVSLVYLTKYWMVVDFSVSQIDRYDGIPVLVLIFKPDRISLKEAVKTAYNWWTKE